MRLGSDAFEQARANMEPVVVRIDVLNGDELVASTAGTSADTKFTLVNSPILSMDASAAIVTAVNTLELQFGDHFVPQDSWGVFSALADTEFHISTGYLVGKQAETQPTAVLTLDTIRLENHGDGRKVYCDLFDRAKKLERSVFGWPRAVAAGAIIPELINELIQEVFPRLTLVAPKIGTGAAAMEIADTDNRLAVINRLAASVGHTFGFDNTGIPHLFPPPQPDADAVVDYSADDNVGGHLLSVCRTLTREGVYNGVIMKASSTRQSDT